MQTLDDMSKLNGLVELCLERRSSLLKTLYQEVLDESDLEEVDKWMYETEERKLMSWEEAVLAWFATNDSISLDDCKARLRPPEEIEIEERNERVKSLVGLHLNVPEYWWEELNGLKLWSCDIDSINLEDEAERYFNLKCLNDPDDPRQEKRYPMSYKDVRKYADRQHSEFSQFYLPETLQEANVDLEFDARCEKTLQELKRLDGKILLIVAIFSCFSFTRLVISNYYRCICLC